ncbi:MAG: hypothetical protein K9L28_02715 [Synergistales bacterium]|nr:hypothetical protein [Synergistales bacterium]
MKQLLPVLLFLSLCVLPATAEGISFPQQVGTFTMDEGGTQTLQTTKGSVGSWQWASYSEHPGLHIHVELLCGSGPGSWDMPIFPGVKSDGPIGSGWTAERIALADRPGVYQHHPSLGGSITLSLPEACTLQVESPGATKAQLIRWTEAWLRESAPGGENKKTAGPEAPPEDRSM